MAERPFTLDTVACLLAALQESGTTLGLRHFQTMADLDGERSASSFEHQFRKVKTRAKELSKGDAAPAKVTTTPRGKKTAVKESPKTAGDADGSKKRTKGKTGTGKSAKVKSEPVDEHGDEGSTAVDEEEDHQPHKKVKLEEDVDNAAADVETADAPAAGEHNPSSQLEDFDDEFKEFFQYDGQAAAAQLDAEPS